MRRLLLAAVLLILYGSFYPWHFAHISGRPFLIPVSLSDTRDLLLNFWVYVPVGALAFWVFGPRRYSALDHPILFGARALHVHRSGAIFHSRPCLEPRRYPRQHAGDLGRNIARRLGRVGSPVIPLGIEPLSGKLPAGSLGRAAAVPSDSPCTDSMLYVRMHGPFRRAPWVWSSLVVWMMAWMVVWELIPGAFVRGMNWIVFGFFGADASGALIFDPPRAD